MSLPYHVLFLCTGNSSRSIMAEAILSRAGAGKFVAHSAGSRPMGEINPPALNLLRRFNHEVGGLRSKSWEEFAQAHAQALDFVFTVCDKAAGEACPIWPGQPMTANWGVPDPAAATGTEGEIAAAFIDAYGRLQNRIEAFVNLPFASLDRLALQKRLDEMGGAADGFTREA